jgi:hypothetical protein
LGSGRRLLVFSLPGRQDLDEADSGSRFRGCKRRRLPNKLEKPMKRVTPAGTPVPAIDPCF